MEWSDKGVVLAVQPHGEGGVLAEVLTQNHGRHLGFVHGVRRLRGLVEKGNVVSLHWRARLPEHMGVYRPEAESLLVGQALGQVLNDPACVFALNSACALALSLPERVPCPEFFERFCQFLAQLNRGDWLRDYVVLEVDLLRELGYGLDLSCCVVTRSKDDLSYVSPKSGKAVSQKAGALWKAVLFPLPSFMVREHSTAVSPVEATAGLRITGHFLKKCVYGDRALPAAREYFCELLNDSVQVLSS